MNGGRRFGIGILDGVTNKDDVDDEERRETEVAVRNDRVQGVKGY